MSLDHVFHFTINTRLSAAALIKFTEILVRRLFEGGAYKVGGPRCDAYSRCGSYSEALIKLVGLGAALIRGFTVHDFLQTTHKRWR